jgi:hypothetical protein
VYKRQDQIVETQKTRNWEGTERRGQTQKRMAET